MNNPDLLNPQTAAPTVQPLVSITAPMPNTPDTAVYFFCTMTLASFHRKDGKKLPFVNHLFKATFKEDIEFLDKEINEYGNPYVRRATEEEANHAKLMEDPMGTVREQVVQDLTIADLERLLEERRRVVPDAAKIAGVDPKPASGAIKAHDVNIRHAAHTGANTATLGALLAKQVKAG
jgi:hypothetical protein